MNHAHFVLESSRGRRVPLYGTGRLPFEDLRDGVTLHLYTGVAKWMLLCYAEYRRTDTLRMLEG